MLLDHTCENEILSRTPKSSADNKDLITGLVSCEEDEYPKLPKCDSDFQSPIHFQPGEFELDDTLQNYVYTNIDQEFDFLMSLPWDGTNLRKPSFNFENQVIIIKFRITRKSVYSSDCRIIRY